MKALIGDTVTIEMFHDQNCRSDRVEDDGCATGAISDGECVNSTVASALTTHSLNCQIIGRTLSWLEPARGPSRRPYGARLIGKYRHRKLNVRIREMKRLSAGLF